VKRIVVGPLISGLVFSVFGAIGACAGSEEQGTKSTDEGGTPESGGDAQRAPDAWDAEGPGNPTCSEDFCLVDLPNPADYGLAKWHFAGVDVDPTIGAWAIANGDTDGGAATAHFLRFESGEWSVQHAPVLDGGGDARSVRLTSLSADGAGQLIAVGETTDDGTAVVVRGDGTSFTTTPFEGNLAAAWFAAPNEAWIVGSNGGVFRSSDDG
jgi:hypothetical protein